MKFVDEVVVHVKAGDGGDGCLSFDRMRFKARGRPNGGDGGKGGNVSIKAVSNLNTLVDYRHQKNFDATNGSRGGSADCIGSGGSDLCLSVPIGTRIYDLDTKTLLGDLNEADATLCVAKGGECGLGNARFKSSTNRSPRRTTTGEIGEERTLHLELNILADVGLLGAPNAGKSSLLAAMSAAKPKIADYAFTTLWPHLGVVSVAREQSFVLADMPGLLPGAAEGIGLGSRFLKHLNRTYLLWQVIDIASEIPCEEQVVSIQQELKNYSDDLAGRERWLVFNKIDLLSNDEAKKRIADFESIMPDLLRVFVVSAVTRVGLDDLAKATINFFDKVRVRSTKSGAASSGW